MEFLKKRPVQCEDVGEKILMIPVEEIVANKNQPRKIFLEDELESLAQSIEELGILQPLTVRKMDKSWELIAGERRLRASQIAGLSTVPCFVLQATDKTSSLMALVENIQRKDLDCFEEAEAIANMISQYGLSQEEVAKKIGKSQSAVANMLRLLRLADEVVIRLREGGCTQRHARALLKIPESTIQLEIVEKIIENSLNVSQTEALVEFYLDPPQEKKKEKKLIILRDVRLFLNTVNRSLDVMRTAGVDAKCQKEETEQEILLTIRIPRQGKGVC